MSSDSKPKQRSRVRRSRLVLTVMLVTVAGAGFLATAYSFHFFGLGTSETSSCGTHSANQPSSASFTILMANEGMNVGFNGSKYHSPPWPVMNATLGQSITIHVINRDAQPHGFAIVHYLDGGVTLRPGECYDATFAANQAGSFTVFCSIFCTIHVYMQDGRLNVS